MRADQYGLRFRAEWHGTDLGLQIRTTYLRQAITRRMDLLASATYSDQLGGKNTSTLRLSFTGLIVA